MSRIKLMKPMVPTAAPRVRTSYDDVRPGRSNSAPYRKLYKTARWARLRMETLKRDNFTCQMCGRIEGDTSKLVCDHVVPHGGDITKFWAGPFQTLCNTPCHAVHKQRMEVAEKAWS